MPLPTRKRAQQSRAGVGVVDILWVPVIGGGEFGSGIPQAATDMRELICIALGGTAALTAGLASTLAETDVVPARRRIRPRAPPATAARPQGL
jgi:hypothetical protein